MKFTTNGKIEFDAKYMAATGRAPADSVVSALVERAATQSAHGDHGPVGFGLGTWQTLNGEAQWIEVAASSFCH